MPFYDLNVLQSDIVQLQNERASFGTGRLIATNLVLTTAHVLRSNGSGEPELEGWSIRLLRDRKEGAPWPFRTGNRVVWHRSPGDLDMALVLLVEPPDGPVRPRLGLRIASVTANNPHAVEARGYPYGAKPDDGPRDLIPAFGLLTGAYRDRPLRFGVESFNLPRDPHKDWPGMSGSAVLLREPPDIGFVWIYGVVQQVPASFIGQLEVTRLADAWSNSSFRRLLVSAGAPDLDATDPTRTTVARSRAPSVTDAGIELLRLLRTTRTTFEAQARVRDQLVRRITARLALDPREINDFEEFLAAHHDVMDDLEKRKFQLIRSFTLGVLHDCNARAKEIIEKYPTLVPRIPSVGKLHDHLRIWLTKYSAVFVNSPDMALLYVGPQEGVPFPNTVEMDLWRFLQKQPRGRRSLERDPAPPSAEFSEAVDDNPSDFLWPWYLEAVWAKNQLDRILTEIDRAKSEGELGRERAISAEIRLAELMERYFKRYRNPSYDKSFEEAKLAIKASCVAPPGEPAAKEFDILWSWAHSLDDAHLGGQIVRFKTDREKDVPRALSAVWPVIRAVLLEELRTSLESRTKNPGVREYWEFGPLAQLGDA